MADSVRVVEVPSRQRAPLSPAERRLVEALRALQYRPRFAIPHAGDAADELEVEFIHAVRGIVRELLP